ncbi:MAG: hypothetical protein NZM34_00325 [Bernardetiaceae bacterium]|nr:hypothetical protein [Bernardetiaceae bacterium]
MKAHCTLAQNSNKRLIGILLGVATLLLLPFVAMQFSHEVKWTLSDFMVAGILLLSAGLTLELILRKVKTRTARVIACIVLFLSLVLIWAELAVGIFGTPFGGY